MPKIRAKNWAISLTKSDTWTTATPTLNGRCDVVADFCINRCPHKEKPCKGECVEYKEFKRSLREKRRL